MTYDMSELNGHHYMEYNDMSSSNTKRANEMNL